MYLEWCNNAAGTVPYWPYFKDTNYSNNITNRADDHKARNGFDPLGLYLKNNIMITGKEQAFAGPSDEGYESGMDIRTWMATQIKVAYIIRGGTTREQRDQWAVEETESLIDELNKKPAP